MRLDNFSFKDNLNIKHYKIGINLLKYLLYWPDLRFQICQIVVAIRHVIVSTQFLISLGNVMRNAMYYERLVSSPNIRTYYHAPQIRLRAWKHFFDCDSVLFKKYSSLTNGHSLFPCHPIKSK